MLAALEEEDDDKDTMDTDSPAGNQQPAHKLGGDPNIPRLPHEIRITNQIMYLHPSLEDCRYNILQNFFSWQVRNRNPNFF